MHIWVSVVFVLKLVWHLVQVLVPSSQSGVKRWR